LEYLVGGGLTMAKAKAEMTDDSEDLRLLRQVLEGMSPRAKFEIVKDYLGTHISVVKYAALGQSVALALEAYMFSIGSHTTILQSAILLLYAVAFLLVVYGAVVDLLTSLYITTAINTPRGIERHYESPHPIFQWIKFLRHGFTVHVVGCTIFAAAFLLRLIAIAVEVLPRVPFK
jgi:hypothetical protein